MHERGGVPQLDIYQIHWDETLGKYQAEVRHLSHAYILLIMGLYEVLIANMMIICGANNIKINIT